MGDALAALVHLAAKTVLDLGGFGQKVECHICGWHGRGFYPDVGSGYFNLDTSCPRCHCIARYRSLAVILDRETGFFSPDKAVIEVAPVRSFQAYCLWRKQSRNYVSFDLENFGMEKGDMTAMRYPSQSCDYFLCFHVLEHIPDEAAAIREIFRVLRPGGQAILQVPVDYSLDETVEYGKPNPFETDHVRRYSASGFSKSLTTQGFHVRIVTIADGVSDSNLQRYGFDAQPVYIATKPQSESV
jgi:SAM-dependent methyltransferase